ncbi:MAG: DUF3090 family protein [Nitriliruptor sp.]|nr:MAG: DUF3090 family protein [Nitriliruptor sp.]
MSDAIFLDPHHVTVGYTGVPGDRSFFLQVEDDAARVTLLLEKGQVEGIGELMGQVLARIDDQPATDWDRDAMALRPPIEPAWRVGEIGLGVDPESERVVLELTEVVADDTVEPSTVQVSLDRDQARRLAAHAQETVTQGRPRCELCGRPMGLDGDHVCPSTNGHGALSR